MSGPKKRVIVGTPIEWLERSTAEEIGQAMLSVDPNKAAAVVLYLAQRTGQEVERIAAQTRQEFQEDPLKAIGGILFRGMTSKR